ncbi:glycosyltransferase family 2 protein [Parabacteroides distasonis]|uniref:Glycosyltransferase family 2 protein n=2 Tax=Bacteroidales TaxID=171549 RepID=A0A3L7ZWB8_PARDI|nr:glycosyltransferase family 2 protein [Parabacteroides distasonis]EEY84553.1 glycosyltransferase, group 2 family protein [Bacteroides sp. 2_1_33B]NBH87487.1 glycosyltransferase family 2 protein [Parabacteroides distasonis]RLT75247.1 glycosyltransferase family 2 protein [Parabacteroides distasonis]
MQLLISIITPCYNAVPFIAQTIESVLAQTYPYWEMLIVDDCSTDRSAEIIQTYVKRDSRIKYFKTDHPSGSPSLPRNIGLKQAQGEYVAFLDSDDAWLPVKLEEQISYMETGCCGFVYSDYEKMAWDGKRNQRFIRARRISSFWDTLESNEIPCLTVLLRKDLIGQTCFKPIPKEDYVFWLEILRKGHKAYNTGKVHALYREAKNSRSGNKFEMFKKQWYVLRKVEEVKRIPAVYFMLIFACKGFCKYLK